MHEVRIDVSNVDWKLLRQQKVHLVALLMAGEGLGQETQDSLDGILELLDHIQDEAAGQLGVIEVFGRTF